MMNRAEQKLILELCRFHNPNPKQIENLKKQGVDEAVVLGQLLFHRVAAKHGGVNSPPFANMQKIKSEKKQRFFAKPIAKTAKIWYHNTVCKDGPCRRHRIYF